MFFLSLFLAPSLLAQDEGGSPCLRFATATTAYSPGLLQLLASKFEKETGCKIEILPVGTGHALRLAAQGEADVTLTHSKAVEQNFLRQGFGLKRHILMENDFVIVGPENDPASIQTAGSPVEAFRKIAQSKSLFVSRGDISGTHNRELAIWKNLDMKRDFNWYTESGLNMEGTLDLANELKGYTLTDRGSWLAHKQGFDLKLLYEGGDIFRNIYALIVVNQEKVPSVNQIMGEKLVKWMLSAETQKMIANFKVNGEVLFRPVTNVQK